jgi:hypothetical protein
MDNLLHPVTQYQYLLMKEKSRTCKKLSTFDPVLIPVSKQEVISL